MRNGGLGEMFRDGDTIIRQGDVGSSMYVIEDGQVEVIHLYDGKAVRLAVLGRGDIFGELSLFGNEERSATVRSWPARGIRWSLASTIPRSRKRSART